MSSTIPADIDFDPQIDGFEEGVNEQGPWVRLPYRVAWADRFRFALAMRGTTSTTGPSGPWIRATPYQYPDPTIGGNLYAKDLVISPASDAVVVGSYPPAFSDAIITVTFGVLDWTAATGDDPLFLSSLSQDPSENQSLQFATQELKFGRQWYDIPNSSVKFKSDGKKINTPSSGSFLIQDMIVTWHRYPVMPMARIRTYADRVNDATFLGCDKGTVRFMGVDTVREASTDGTITQKVRMVLQWREFDWNKKVREDGYTWDVVVDSTSGNELYPYADFRLLLL